MADEVRWTHAKTAREMQVGERGYIYFEAVNWQNWTVDLDGLVFGPGVRTLTCHIWRISEDKWVVMRKHDLVHMNWNEKLQTAGWV